MSKQYAVKNQLGNFLGGAEYEQVLTAHFREVKNIEINDKSIDIIGQEKDPTSDRIVVKVYVHGL